MSLREGGRQQVGLGVGIGGRGGMFSGCYGCPDVCRFYWCVPGGGRCQEMESLFVWEAAELLELGSICPFYDPASAVPGVAAKMAGGQEWYAALAPGWMREGLDASLGDSSSRRRRRWAAGGQWRSFGCSALQVAHMFLFLFLFLLLLFVVRLRFWRRRRDRLCLFVYLGWSPS